MTDAELKAIAEAAEAEIASTTIEFPEWVSRIAKRGGTPYNYQATAWWRGLSGLTGPDKTTLLQILDAAERDLADGEPEPPNGDFTWSPLQPTVGQEVTFTATSTTPNPVYTWQPLNLSGNPVTFTYQSTGSKTVQLLVNGTIVQTKMLTVESQPPQPSFYRWGHSAGSIEWNTQADLEREIGILASVGSKVYRFDIKWSAWEWYGRGTDNGDYVNRVRMILSICRSLGVEPFVSFAYTPAWNRPAGTDDKQQPTNLAAYGEWVGRVVPKLVQDFDLRYAEQWNEVNIGFWRQPNPVAYVDLCKGGYPAFKAAGVDTVCVGAFAPVGSVYASDSAYLPNYNPVVFLRKMYEAGARKGVTHDAISHHPYADTTTAIFNDYGFGCTFNSNPSLRSVMNANGEGDVLIHGTEAGTALTWVGGNEQTQATLVETAMREWITEPTCGLYLYYAPKLQTLDEFDMWRTDWSPRPVAGRYQAVTASQPAPAEQVREMLHLAQTEKQADLSAFRRAKIAEHTTRNPRD